MSPTLAPITGGSSISGVICAPPLAADRDFIAVVLWPERRNDLAIELSAAGAAVAHRLTVGDVRLPECRAGAPASRRPAVRWQPLFSRRHEGATCLSNGRRAPSRSGAAMDTPLTTIRTPIEGEWTCPPNVPSKPILLP